MHTPPLTRSLSGDMVTNRLREVNLNMKANIEAASRKKVGILEPDD
jgi:hypothetical protein